MTFHSLYSQRPKEKKNRDSYYEGSKTETITDGCIVMEPLCIHSWSPFGIY